MHSWKLPIAGLVGVMLLLVGCATASSDACPPLVEYSKEQLQAAAVAVEMLPADSILIEMLADYSVTRAQLRACRPR